MITSEQINEIAKAMSLAQAIMKPAEKDSVNPHFKSRYSDLSSSWESIRKPITDNGLSVWQDVTSTDAGIAITTRVVHCSGQWIEFGPLNIPTIKKDAQGFGSAITYGKRYALCAAMGIVADDDDDGNEASTPQYKSQNNYPQKYEPPVYEDIDAMEKAAKPEPRVTIAQALELDSLADGDQEIIKKLFSHYKIDSFASIKEKNYGYIKQKLLEKRQEKARETA